MLPHFISRSHDRDVADAQDEEQNRESDEYDIEHSTPPFNHDRKPGLKMGREVPEKFLRNVLAPSRPEGRHYDYPETVVVADSRGLPTVVVLTFRSALIARREPVPDPRLAQEYRGLVGSGLDLLAELRDERPEVLGLLDRIRPPDGLENRAVREDTIVVMREQRQQLELFRRQTNLRFAL